jgi:hypothetical protein
MTQEEYLNQIEHRLRQLLEEVRQEFAGLPMESLTRRLSSPKQWNLLECFEHINRKFAVDIPKLEYAIHKAKARKLVHHPEAVQQFTWFARKKLRQYALTNARRTKTAKKWNPLGADLSPAVVKSLIIQMEKMLRVVQQSREVDLNKTVLKAGCYSLFSINLGNFMEVITVHTERHIQQARQILVGIK